MEDDKVTCTTEDYTKRLSEVYAPDQPAPRWTLKQKIVGGTLAAGSAFVLYPSFICNPGANPCQSSLNQPSETALTWVLNSGKYIAVCLPCKLKIGNLWKLAKDYINSTGKDLEKCAFNLEKTLEKDAGECVSIVETGARNCVYDIEKDSGKYCFISMKEDFENCTSIAKFDFKNCSTYVSNFQKIFGEREIRVLEDLDYFKKRALLKPVIYSKMQLYTTMKS
jgi:hypothetical protein